MSTTTLQLPASMQRALGRIRQPGAGAPAGRSGARPAAMAPEAYDCLGALLEDAFVQFKGQTALIEMNRKRESRRIEYGELGRLSCQVAQGLKDAGVGAGDRVAILMSNQPAWLGAATGAMMRGAVLVPLDYKLTPAEQRALLAHCEPKLLITEYPIWRRLSAPGALADVGAVWVSEAPPVRDGEDPPLTGEARRFEDLPTEVQGAAELRVPRRREDVATIVYSSGTGGVAKGCVLTHDNYLSQLDALLQLFPMSEGDRYFSILPTNHAIDFMCGFVGSLASGATVVHQRTLRPEFIVDTMRRQRITHMAIVPLLLEAFERALDEGLAEQPGWKQSLVTGLSGLNGFLTERRPNHGLSRRLLAPVHDKFGGHLKMLFCGGAFVERQRAQRFYDLGLPVAIGYGLTECCTVATVNNLRPFRADSVGSAAPGVEIRIDLDGDGSGGHGAGIGEVLIRGRTVMQGYLDAPELTAETIVDGWLHTGDVGWMDAAHHLHLVGRSRNMIVTAGGKNVYPEDVEAAFGQVDCEELAVFAANYIWPPTGAQSGGAGDDTLTGERLVAVVRSKKRGGQAVAGANGDATKSTGATKSTEATEATEATKTTGALASVAIARALGDANRRLADFKRVDGVVTWDQAFPRTASMKLKRKDLALQLRQALDRGAINEVTT